MELLSFDLLMQFNLFIFLPQSVLFPTGPLISAARMSAPTEQRVLSDLFIAVSAAPRRVAGMETGLNSLCQMIDRWMNEIAKLFFRNSTLFPLLQEVQGSVHVRYFCWVGPWGLAGILPRNSVEGIRSQEPCNPKAACSAWEHLANSRWGQCPAGNCLPSNKFNRNILKTCPASYWFQHLGT